MSVSDNLSLWFFTKKHGIEAKFCSFHMKIRSYNIDIFNIVDSFWTMDYLKSIEEVLDCCVGLILYEYMFSKIDLFLALMSLFSILWHYVFLGIRMDLNEEFMHHTSLWGMSIFLRDSILSVRNIRARYNVICCWDIEVIF